MTCKPLHNEHHWTRKGKAVPSQGEPCDCKQTWFDPSKEFERGRSELTAELIAKIDVEYEYHNKCFLEFEKLNIVENRNMHSMAMGILEKVKSFLKELNN